MRALVVLGALVLLLGVFIAMFSCFSVPDPSCGEQARATGYSLSAIGGLLIGAAVVRRIRAGH